jgi:acyl-CoA thioester hydrolase
MDDIATLAADAGTQRVPEPYKHVYEFNVRFGDIDSQLHVNNVKFLGYLEDARLSMFHADPIIEGIEPVRGMVISRHEIDYLRPLTGVIYPIRVESWVTEARAASFKLAYEVRDHEHVYATATSSIVAFDVEAARLRRWTPEERAYIMRFLKPKD